MRGARADDRLFVKVALDILVNGKLADAPTASRWLYVAGLVVARRDLTDGVVRTAVVVAEAEVSTRHVKDLVDRNLWHLTGHDCERCVQPAKGSAVIHDYLLHNSSKAEVDEHRQVRSKAGRKGAAARWGDGKSHDMSDSKSHGKQGAMLIAESERESEDLVVTSLGQSPQVTRGNGLTDDEIEKIQQRLGCDTAHATRVVATVLSKVKPGVTIAKPLRYVLAAIDDDPAAYQPTKTAGRKADQCTVCNLRTCICHLERRAN